MISCEIDKDLHAKISLDLGILNSYMIRGAKEAQHVQELSPQRTASPQRAS